MMMPVTHATRSCRLETERIGGSIPARIAKSCNTAQRGCRATEARNMEEDAYEAAVLSIGNRSCRCRKSRAGGDRRRSDQDRLSHAVVGTRVGLWRSEEHTSELQSHS